MAHNSFGWLVGTVWQSKDRREAMRGRFEVYDVTMQISSRGLPFRAWLKRISFGFGNSYTNVRLDTLLDRWERVENATE